jgi:Ca2+-binding RTX toxin-like protein
MPLLTKQCNNGKMTLSLCLNNGVFCFILLVSSIMFLGNVSDAWALTRGTPYDDLLSSDMRSSNITEVAGAEEGVNATNSEFIYGDYGNDEIQGSDRSDHLSGGPGSDVIYGNNGGDFIQGGPGFDSLYGGEGNDVLSGGEGADYFDCGPGRDGVDDFNPSEGDFALDNCEVLENEEAPSQ